MGQNLLMCKIITAYTRNREFCSLSQCLFYVSKLNFRNLLHWALTPARSTCHMLPTSQPWLVFIFCYRQYCAACASAVWTSGNIR